MNSHGATFEEIITKYKEELLQALRDAPTNCEGSTDVQEITSLGVTESGEVSLWAWD